MTRSGSSTFCRRVSLLVRNFAPHFLKELYSCTSKNSTFAHEINIYCYAEQDILATFGLKYIGGKSSQCRSHVIISAIRELSLLL